MADITIRIEDHSGDILRALEEKKAQILEAWGQQGVTNVKNVITAESRVDTGAMRNSINHQVQESESAVYVGTNDSKAVYHEYGTGIYLESEDGRQGRQTPWSYQDSHGEWHWTRGMKPIHMLKNGIGNHVSDFKKIAETELKK